MASLDQYALPLTFPTYSPSFRERQQTIEDFSPASCSSHEDFSADLTNDWSSTPGSPRSPVLPAGSYAPFRENDWMERVKAEGKPEPFEGLSLSSIPVIAFQSSPVIHPLDLTLTNADGVFFGCEDPYDNQALFQAQAPSSMRPRQAAVDPVGLATSRSSMGPASSTLSTSQQTPPAKRSLRKRKSSPEDEDELFPQRSSGSSPPASRRRQSKDSERIQQTMGPKKTTHNMIEKRYRNNLNDKIAALRDSVPALRVMGHRLEPAQDGEEGDEEGLSQEQGDVGGIAPAHKLNKATILGKATEYILHLEGRNQSLAKENAALRSRMEDFEMLVMSRESTNGMWNS